VSGNSKSREELVREAFQVRSKLLRTVGELDERRHRARDFRTRLQHRVRDLAVGAGLVAVAAASVVALLVSRAGTASDRRRRDRWRLAGRLWWNPEKVLRAERRSFFGEVGRSLLLAAASTAVTVTARRLVAKIVSASGGPAR
jgi:hypothetical protein